MGPILIAKQLEVVDASVASTVSQKLRQEEGKQIAEKEPLDDTKEDAAKEKR